MSAAVHLVGLSSSVPGALDLTMEFDRVVRPPTTGPTGTRCRPSPTRRPIMVTWNSNAAGMMSRRNTSAFATSSTRPDMMPWCSGWPIPSAWFASGGDLGQDLCSKFGFHPPVHRCACRAVISDNVQSSRVFEEELAGLGFQLKERPWYEDTFQVVAELCHNKRVATDMGGGCSQVRREADCMRALRRRLTGLDGNGSRVGQDPEPRRRGDLS